MFGLCENAIKCLERAIMDCDTPLGELVRAVEITAKASMEANTAAARIMLDDSLEYLRNAILAEPDARKAIAKEALWRIRQAYAIEPDKEADV